ncbi:type II toxin-antitoxin system Phd/YefM family antitoxin [Tunicatimonas pelagia]|uniref:type II toxin-antitoxin system Phd/YefM family antitoxin n=1 Tax=Tunicatimonas pelagia TaxID=931531 RepID=UPI0026650EA2|nr:hypothetical protein [Tunicatimonas pelagia]WKN41512.1 hypothetical protein P0M28_20970 [Tunicatimonas pelagia]
MASIDTYQLSPDKMREALQQVLSGEEVLVYENGKLLFKITEVEKVAERTSGKKRQFGFRKGALKYMASDFNEPLDDFKDYMPE